jgi:hypothetical protein
MKNRVFLTTLLGEKVPKTNFVEDIKEQGVDAFER